MIRLGINYLVQDASKPSPPSQWATNLLVQDASNVIQVPFGVPLAPPIHSPWARNPSLVQDASGTFLVHPSGAGRQIFGSEPSNVACTFGISSSNLVQEASLYQPDAGRQLCMSLLAP